MWMMMLAGFTCMGLLAYRHPLRGQARKTSAEIQRRLLKPRAVTRRPYRFRPLKTHTQHELALGICLQLVEITTVGPTGEDDEQQNCSGEE
jgi:hypothetical protein